MHIHLTHAQSLHSFVLVHVRSHAISHSPIPSVTHVFSFTHTTSRSYTPLLSPPVCLTLPGCPWPAWLRVTLAASPCHPPGFQQCPRPAPAWPSPLCRGRPGGDGSGGRVAAGHVAKQAGPRPDAGPLLHSSQNRSSWFLHRPKVGGVLTDVTHAPLHPALPSNLPATPHPGRREKSSAYLSPALP